MFTINDINIKVQEQIDEKIALQELTKKVLINASTEIEKQTNAKNDLLLQLYKDCWYKTKTLREKFDKTQKGKKKSQQFTKEVRAHKPIYHDINTLTLMYASAYSETAKQYERFNTISNTNILDEIENSYILELVIANIQQTDFATFLNGLGATEWFRHGHENFHAKANGKCPYCGRPVEPNFEKIVAESFDDRYKKNIQKLEDFLNTYQLKANELLTQLSKTPSEIYPPIDTKIYFDNLAMLRAIISNNLFAEG